MLALGAPAPRARTAALSDGFGNILFPDAWLELDAETVGYARRWLEEETGDAYSVGCPDFKGRQALIFAIDAARSTCGMGYPTAVDLLGLAIAELERE